MKSLSLSRPLVLMVIGAPGSGKSFFARQFADTFSAPLVSVDFIRSSIDDASAEANAAVELITRQQIQELVKTQKTFLVDGGLNVRTERMAVEKMAKEYGYGTMIIWVQTDEPTSRYRATKRNPRRQGDTYNTSISEKQFDILSRRLTPPSPQETFVVVSGKHTYATQARILLKKLVTPRQEQVNRVPPQAAVPPTHEQPPHAPHRRNVIIN